MVAGATGYPGAYKNCVARIDGDVSAQEVLKRSRDFFGKRGRGFTIFARASRDQNLETELQSQGLVVRADSPCMLIEAPLPPGQIPDRIRVERFTEERHVRDAVLINSGAYQMLGLPAAETEAFFSQPSRLLSPGVAGYVAYSGARPVATALTISSGNGAGVYWVGTVADTQRGGLGTLCTRLATNAGFSAGAKVVTLQASPFGEPVYRRLGYKTYDRLRWYRHPAPA